MLCGIDGLPIVCLFCHIRLNELAHGVAFQKQKSVVFIDSKADSEITVLLYGEDGLRVYMK